MAQVCMNSLGAWRFGALVRLLSVVLCVGAAACEGDPAVGDSPAADTGLALPADRPSSSFLDQGAPEGADDAGPPEEDADRRGPRLNSLIPNSGPLSGGTPVRLVGTGFLEGTVVSIGERDCQDTVVVNENHIDCVTPPGFATGDISVTVRWSVGGAPHRTEDAFTYYVPVTVTALTPDRGPARGGTEVIIDGDGFVEGTEVRFAGSLARSTFVDANRLTAVVPAGEPGPIEVLVRNAFGEVRLPGGYTYFEDLVVLDLEPRWGPVAGGTEVGFRGAGLVEGGRVVFGEAEAAILRSELDRTRLVVETPGGRAGLVNVALENVNGTWRGQDAFLYVDPDATGFEVVGVVPGRVSSAGGDVIEIGGAGFSDATVALIDDVPLDCAATNANILRCTAPAHAAGAVDVVVRDGDDSGVLPGGLTFFQRVDIYTLRPNRGAVPGGTVVEVRGEGFTEEMNLTLDGEPLGVLEFVDDGLLWAITPPGRPGLVSVGAATSDDTVLLPEAFEYFSPSSRFGGVFGEPIAGAVNVTVLDAYSGEPIPDAVAMSVPSDGPDGAMLLGTTNADGQVVLSERVVTPPQNVTACAVDYECTTVERQTVENVTVYLVPHNPPSGNGGGGGGEIPNARIAGEIVGLNLLEKPIDPYVLLAFVNTTHTSPYNRRVNLPGEPRGVLPEDGPFEIFAKPGEMAAVVTAGIVLSADYDLYRDGVLRYWELHETMIPVAMGFQRFLSLSPGAEVEGLRIEIDRPMDLEVPVRQANPPAGAPEQPYVYEAWPFLDFGAEGYWELDTKGFGDDPALTVTHLPDIRAWDQDIRYEWILWGHSGQQLQIRLPYTVTTEHTRDVTAGLDVGPISSLALIDRPTTDLPLGPDRAVEWHWAEGADGTPTTPPDAVVINIDASDGLPLWTYIVPGDVTRIELPELPAAVVPGGLVDGTMLLQIVPFIAERGLNFEDFTYEDLGYWSRHSYSASGVSFEP
jgi:hypothetical protein